ncbi:alpha/beta fold hydrolase [Diaminobutyricimonas sp. LJ205]|uniref:alpha/beta fold hydrolase n=1 Tax=Diaminobutyricimonas sp. LJ205 TaxID=2683590 RepID=UPI0012F52329|nr:alpha/beta hydrolase [Diaminobutyricimonas sp. LJ205]
MPAALTTTRAAIAAASAISPRLGAELAFPLFMRVGPRLPVHARDRATHEAARRSSITVHGKRVEVYAWGHGTDVVLLVHGWRGRASQYATLVRELVAEGFTVVSFDAPANGDSAGRGTYIFEYVDAMRQLERQYGGFHTVVAHSFGLLAALSAIDDGMTAGRLVGVAGVAEANNLIEGFASVMRLTPATTGALREVFQRRVFPGQPDLFKRFSGLEHPVAVPLLLLHDRGDRMVPATQSEALAGVHEGSRLVVTEGLGHNRILAADQTLDAVLEFVTARERAGVSP